MLDFVITGLIDREASSFEALVNWLKAAPFPITLSTLTLDDEELDLQEFETTAERLVTGEFVVRELASSIDEAGSLDDSHDENEHQVSGS